MTSSPHLGMPLIAASQAQKHVTHNQAIIVLDSVVQLSVKDSIHAAPPASPAEGDRYKVASGATGAWAGWDLNIALFTDGAWSKIVPQNGWLCFDEASGAFTVKTAAGWIDLSASSGFLTMLAAGTVKKLGINAAADTTNRLTLKSDAALFTHDDVTPGTGHLRLTLNKSAAARDACFVFQDGYSTRALFGLLGDDNFTVKVSPDGSTFRTALTVDRSTGRVTCEAHAKFSAWCNFGQNYAAGAWQELYANNTRHNDKAAFASVGNVGIFTAPIAGYFMFGLGATFETPGSIPTKMQIGLSVNNAAPTPDTVTSTGDAAITSGKTSCATTACLKLAAGDTVRGKILFTGNTGRVLADENYFWGAQLP
ncbi:DUF2793 domain-containing protein [Rhodopseudomonas palustris]|uniref:DUF2793 domain-containing protein n=1 Tax=Rhodopseudomonas palustris TaxID=1076 RepID=A0A418V424_RHOPL|nr:DUF2793 domain-containing protein [Rhodopseudomonas palustris]RJF70861.1 DUF2793 domain-containing protein [Rhodopseudomonas palustris]